MSLFKNNRLSIYWFLSFLLPLVSNAASEYQILQPIDPYINQQAGTTPAVYFNQMFKLGIAVATGLAVIKIVIGGIHYLSTDSISEKADGKESIKAALWGLILALASYMILRTINPQLISLDINNFGR